MHRHCIAAAVFVQQTKINEIIAIMQILSRCAPANRTNSCHCISLSVLHAAVLSLRAAGCAAVQDAAVQSAACQTFEVMAWDWQARATLGANDLELSGGLAANGNPTLAG